MGIKHILYSLAGEMYWLCVAASWETRHCCCATTLIPDDVTGLKMSATSITDPFSLSQSQQTCLSWLSVQQRSYLDKCLQLKGGCQLQQNLLWCVKNALITHSFQTVVLCEFACNDIIYLGCLICDDMNNFILFRRKSRPIMIKESLLYLNFSFV